MPTFVPLPSDASFDATPRTLKEPVLWRFSAFIQIEAPVFSESTRDSNTGV